MGLLSGALGRLWSPEDPVSPLDALFSETAALYADALERDLAAAPSTAGLRNIVLPAYENYRKEGHTANDAGAMTLLHLIAQVEDTNLYHRGGQEGATWAKNTAQTLLNNAPTIAEHERLDDAFISRNLSPGGSADLLAATYFLEKCDKKR